MSRRLLSRLLAVLLGLALVEGALALAIEDGSLLGHPLPPFGAINGPRQRAWVERLRSPEPFRLARFDAELGWEWKPGAVSEDGTIHLNTRGARGQREYADQPPAGVVRVLAFGDSYTFCDEMDDGSSFEHYLELRRSELEVWNLGVNGYGTDQSLLRYRRRGRDKGADVVLIGILAENVGRNVNRLRPLWNPSSGFCFPKPRFVLQANGALELLAQPYADRAALVAAFDAGTLVDSIHEHEHWLARPDLGLWAHSRIARLVGLTFAHRARDPLARWADAEGEPRRVTLALLAAFQAEALADGARRAPVLLFPSREDLREIQAHGRGRWDVIPAALAEAGIEHIDLSEPLLQRLDELDADPAQGTLHFRGHHSSVGNDVVARTIERWLVEARILSAAAEPATTTSPTDDQ